MSRHLIEDLVVEIATDGSSPEVADEAWLRRMVVDCLLPVLEEVLDGAGEGDAVLVLPALEIDLGELAAANVEQVAPQRLRAALADALQRALATARQANGPAAAGAASRDPGPLLVSRTDSDLARLEHFLATGTMPWHADSARTGLHEALLDSLLAQGDAALWAALARALAAPASARRLAEQFPEHQLLAVLRGVAGAQAPPFEAVLAQATQGRSGGKLPSAVWVRVLEEAFGAAGEAEVEAACMRLRANVLTFTARKDGVAGAGGVTQQFLAFLESGVLPGMPDGEGPAPHHALLERWLEAGAPNARALIERILGRPGSVQRLVGQFPARQLRAMVGAVAGAHAAPFEALIEELGQECAADALPPVVWGQVLEAACGAGGDAGAQAACSRLRSALAPSAMTADSRARADSPADSPVESGAGAGGAGLQDANQDAKLPMQSGVAVDTAVADTDALRIFLESGVLPGAFESVGTLAHVALLGRLLEQDTGGVWRVLASALLHPSAARRFAQQFPEHQMRAVLRRLAGAHAAAFEALLDESLAWPAGVGGGTHIAVRAEALAACAAGANAQSACARIRATHGGAPVGQAPAEAIGALAHFLEHGILTGAAAGQAPEALLARLLAHDAAALWPVLRRALADPASAGRLAERFPEQQLTALLRQAQPAHAAQCEALLDETRTWAGGTRAMAMAWRLVLALCIPRAAGMPDIAPGLARVRSALARGRALHDARRAALAYRRYPGHAPGAADAAASMPPLLRRFAPAQPAQRPAPSLPRKPQALLRVLAAYLAGAGIPPGLRAQSGQAPHHALLERVLEQGNSGMWLALERVLADPACARRLREDFPPDQVKAVIGRLGSGQAAAAESSARMAGGADDTPPAPRTADAKGEQEAPAYRTQVERLQRFLASGLLPGADAAGGRSAHEALLDGLAAQADGQLWRVLAAALEREDSAERLLTQFPQRQLLGLARTSAPGYAPALERVLRRIEAQAAHPDAANGRLLQACLRQVLAACVARPAVAALPARVVAKTVLALDVTPDSAAAVYVRHTASRSHEAAERWRTSATESHAVRALVQLAGMAGGLREQIVAAYEAEHKAEHNAGHKAERTAEYTAEHEAQEVSSTAPADAAWEPGLTLRERERMARALERLCLPDPPHAAGLDDIPALHGAIAAQLAANAAIAPGHRAVMLEAIAGQCDEAADPAACLRAVLAVLESGTPLDLDALPAQEPVPAPPTPASAPTAARMLVAALQAGDGAAILAHWRTLLPAQAVQLRGAVRHYARHARVRHALAAALPDALFLDLVGLLDAEAAAFLHTLLTPVAPLQALVGHGAAWTDWTLRCRLHALATLAGSPAQRRIDPEDFLRAVAPGAEVASPLLALVGAGKTPAASDTPGRPQPLRPPQPMAAAPARGPAQGPRFDAGCAAPASPVLEDSSDLLAIGNAGMVLAAPYLPRLFGALGLLVGGAFIDDAAAGRAVHLLQYMVTGQAETPEYQLVLNKILCGLPTSAPVPAGIAITGAEHDFIESLIGAMVVHAKVFGSSSVAAMRQTFLARKADLQLADDAWQLQIQPGPFDVLLDRLPWSYSLLKFGWMTRPVHVAWRPA